MLPPMRVENRELLSIGRFGVLTGLTPKALRHYDEVGLLRPAYVDPETSYRWYALDQARTAEAIRRLRDLQLPLEEIGHVLTGDDALLRERLEVHRARIEGHAVESARILVELDRLIRGAEELVPGEKLAVAIEERPEIVYAVIRNRGAALEELGVLIPAAIGQTGKWVFEHGGPIGPPAAFSPMLDESTFDLRVGWPIGTGEVPPAPIERHVVPAGPAAVYVHVGEYSGLHQVWRRICESLNEDGVEPHGEPHELYETSPEEVDDPSEHVTRIVWPLDEKEA